MRFIKRLIFVIILLLIAFFIYRLVSPKAAKDLLYDLKMFSNTMIGTHFTLSGEVLATTGTVLDITGALVEDTGTLQEFTGDEELLLNDMELDDSGTQIPATGTVKPSTPCPAMPTVASCPTGQERYVSYSSTDCGTYYSCRTKTTTTTSTTTKTTTTSSSSNGLSSKDLRDLKSLLQNFGN